MITLETFISDRRKTVSPVVRDNTGYPVSALTILFSLGQCSSLQTPTHGLLGGRVEGGDGFLGSSMGTDVSDWNNSRLIVSPTPG